MKSDCIVYKYDGVKVIFNLLRNSCPWKGQANYKKVVNRKKVRKYEQ